MSTTVVVLKKVHPKRAKEKENSSKDYTKMDLAAQRKKSVQMVVVVVPTFERFVTARRRVDYNFNWIVCLSVALWRWEGKENKTQPHRRQLKTDHKTHPSLSLTMLKRNKTPPTEEAEFCYDLPVLSLCVWLPINLRGQQRNRTHHTTRGCTTQGCRCPDHHPPISTDHPGQL